MQRDARRRPRRRRGEPVRLARSCSRRSTAGRSSSTSSTPLAAAGIDDVVVVLGADAAAVEAAIAWRGERRRGQPATRGRARRARSGSGLDGRGGGPGHGRGPHRARRPAADAARGDRARSSPPPAPPTCPSSGRATPRDGAPNPVLVRREAWALAAGLSGDRGLGPLLARAPGARPRGRRSAGANPDVDTPADLALARADGRRRRPYS